MLTTTVLLLGADDRDVPEVGDRDAVVGRFHSWDLDAQAWFADQLAAAVVGWRCVIVGPQVDAAAAEAQARAAGAVAEEITIVVTDRTERRVYCPACGTSTNTADEKIDCIGCGTSLTVGEHFSPRLAAYLGSP